MKTRTRVLLVSGSLRGRSTNTATLRTAGAIKSRHVEAVLYEGLATLPQFNPDQDGDTVPAAVAELREQIRAADAVLFSVPEYAGALPGALKNLLDWSIGDERPGSIYEKPAAWINASPRGAVNAHDQLRLVLAYAHVRLIEPACTHIPVTAAMLDDNLHIADDGVRERIEQALMTLTAHISVDDTIGSR